MERFEQIHKIKEVLREWGATTAGELSLDICPVLACPVPNVCALVERFGVDSVGVTTYVHDRDADTYDMPYEELPDDVLDEVFQIIEDYGIDMERAMNRSKD